jgi:hypothetical protein
MAVLDPGSIVDVTATGHVPPAVTLGRPGYRSWWSGRQHQQG